MNEDYPRRECEHAIKTAVEEAVGDIKNKQDDMYKRLFVDNGSKSVQSSLSSLAGHVKFQWYMLSLLIIGLLGLAWRAIL